MSSEAPEERRRTGDVYYVYLLESISDPGKRYIGFTSNLKNRFRSHNEGGSVHMAKYKPWKLVAYFAFTHE
jgi:predicted GIY-YIG superfamily endonuclease